MVRADAGAPGDSRLLQGEHDDPPRPVGEAGHAPLLEQVAEGVDAGHEPLLDRLLGHAHPLPDLRPRGAAAPGLIDEVADQMVGDLVELARHDDCDGQVVEGLALGCLLRHVIDEVVESYREPGHASTID